MVRLSFDRPLKLGILISGRGSNMEAVAMAVRDEKLEADIQVVISDNPVAPGLEKAKSYGIQTVVVDRSQFGTREDLDAEFVRILKEYDVNLVLLAGYLKLITPVFIEAFPFRILNIHPSLLPSFKGLHAQKQALDYGVKVSGCTVHFVDEGLDSGPIFMQQEVPVYDSDSEVDLCGRILVEEHQLIVRSLQLISEFNFECHGRQISIEEQR